MIQYQAFPPSFTIAELVFQVCRSGKVTSNHFSAYYERALTHQNQGPVTYLLP